jgi:hypothetical protein
MTIIVKDIIKYKTILVKDNCKLPNKGAFKFIKSLISNCFSMIH